MVFSPSLITKRLWVAVGLLTAAAAGVAAWKAWPLLHPEVVASAPLDPACDLHAAPCTSKLPGGGQVTLELTPRPVRPMAPLTITATVRGRETEAMEVDFQGVEMNMGFNRPALADLGDGRFSGGGMLPVCVRDDMAWEARLLIHTAEGLIDAPFRFTTHRAAPGENG